MYEFGAQYLLTRDHTCTSAQGEVVIPKGSLAIVNDRRIFGNRVLVNFVFPVEEDLQYRTFWDIVPQSILQYIDGPFEYHVGDKVQVLTEYFPPEIVTITGFEDTGKVITYVDKYGFDKTKGRAFLIPIYYDIGLPKAHLYEARARETAFRRRLEEQEEQRGVNVLPRPEVVWPPAFPDATTQVQHEVVDHVVTGTREGRLKYDPYLQLRDLLDG